MGIFPGLIQRPISPPDVAMSTYSPLHGTCIVWRGRGLLILGEPGSGKSSFALECIHHGAQLVADDVVLLRDTDGNPFATGPRTLHGCLALRGLGILTLPFVDEAPLAMIVRLGNHLVRSCEMIGTHTLPSITFSHNYAPRVALTRHLLFTSSPDEAWRKEDWLPQRVSS